MTDLEKTNLITDVDSDYQVGMPDLHMVPDRHILHFFKTPTFFSNVTAALINGCL